MPENENDKRLLAALAQEFTPLNSATELMVARVRINDNDRLSVGLVEDGKRFLVRPYAVDGGGNAISPSYEASHQWVTRVPERRQQAWNTWLLGATDVTALIINAVWRSDQIVFEDELARITFHYLLTRFLSQTMHARTKAEFKVNGSLPPWPADAVDHAELPLAPYQRVGLVTSLATEASALFMEQGTGKTAVVIRRVCVEAGRMRASGERRLYRVLVVCPKSVRTNWENEVQRFTTVSGRTVIMRGNVLDRTKLLIDAFADPEDSELFTMVVSSYEMVRRSWAQLGLVEWDLVVLDESHMIKSSYTQRFKHMLALRERSKHRMLLTGTPICNTLMDVWSQLEFLGQGLSGFTSFKAFRDFYGRWERSHDGRGEMLVGFQNVPILQERLARLALMISKKEALPDLPEKVYDCYEVSMTPEQRKLYVELQQRLRVEIDAELAEMHSGAKSRQVTVNNILVKLLRLAQVTSGFVRCDAMESLDGEAQPGEITHLEPNPKIAGLLDLLSQLQPGEKAIVWATFVPDIMNVSAALTQVGVNHVVYYGGCDDRERETAVSRFNKSAACRVFVGNPEVGGQGINLWGYDPDAPAGSPEAQTNCTRVIYFSQNWSSVQRSQSEDRAHRRGTRRHVTYTDLVVPGTIDEEIRARVVLKRTMAMEVQDVKDVMRRLLEVAPIEEDE